MSIEKIKVNGRIYDIRDVEDVKKEETRAVAAEEELMLRIQGTSAKSDSRKDPFKFIGPASDEGYTYEAFNDALDDLLYSNDVVGFNSGYFRARVQWREVEIKNIVLSTSSQNIVQVVSGAIIIDNGLIVADDAGGYTTLMRQHVNGNWGEWKETYASSSSGGGGGEVSPELEAQVNENTANIAQNTSDIEKLMKKNFPLTVSFSVSPSGLQEYGTTVNTVTANWSIDGADVEVLGIELRLGSGSWIDVTGKTNHTFSNAGITSDTTVYFGADISGEDYINKQASINFAYAAYMRVVDKYFAVPQENLDVKEWSKLDLSTNRSRSYTTEKPLNMQKILYAYAQTYGAISKIVDGNGYNVTDSFYKKETTIDGVAYYAYISKDATITDEKVTVNFS